MNIWILGDMHIGLKKGNSLWHDVYDKWANEFFFPLIEKEKKNDDIFIQLGDVYDNRENIHNVSLNKGIEFFEKCSNIFKKSYVLLGNHDVYGKFSNEVNSVSSLRHIKNLTVISDGYEMFEYNGKKLAIFSWYPDKQKEKEDVNKVQSDYVFGHFETSGIKFNNYTTMEEGKYPLSLNDFNHYEKAFSGHIHHTAVYDNYYNCGNIFEMDKGDSGNIKGVWKLNTETGEVTFYENKVTPIFRDIDLYDLFLMNEENAKSLIEGNMIDLFLGVKLNYASGILTESFSQYINETLKPYHLRYKNYKKEKQEVNATEILNRKEIRKTFTFDEAILECLSKDLETIPSKKDKIIFYFNQIITDSLQSLEV